MSDEEDDMPIVFRRTNASSKPIQISSQTKKPSSAQVRSNKPSNDDFPRRSNASSAVSKNPCSSSTQNGKVISSAKSPPMKSLAASPVASTSSATAASVKVAATNSKVPMSSVSQSKPSAKINSAKEERDLIEPVDAKKNVSLPKKNAVAVKEERDMAEPSAARNSDSEDSEDDKPLSTRISTGLSKGSSSHENKGLSTSSPGSMLPLSSKVKESPEDSDDEKPLSSRLSLKSSVGPSSNKPNHSDGKKPLASKIHQNGSVDRSSQLGKSSTVLKKRPLDVTNSSGQSSAKKLKPPVGSAPMKTNVSVKAEVKTEDEDHIPISQRIKNSAPDNKSLSAKQKVTKIVSSSFKQTMKSKKMTKNSKYSKSTKVPPSSGEGQKWTTLVHNGVIFPPPYKPHGVKMLYDGKPVDLTPEQEEVATMFAVMKETEYASKPKFIENFMADWKKILGKNHLIKDFARCDFTPIYEWHEKEKEKKKQMTSEEKKVLKEEKLKNEEKYMWAIVDGVKEKVGNFRVEPPGLFRGRGEHPKMGKLKKRICPSDITINIGKGAPIPECPIPGESWKEIKHDNTVTWLAFWNDPINPKEFKYVFLAASSSLKGQSDKEKYEKARLLKDYIQGIRTTYTKDFVSKDDTKRQVAVATYLIDKLALRAGNEKDDDEADTVGCCTLKVENVFLKPPNILKFDFLGKDSIRYENEVEVELPVYKAIEQFQKGKLQSDNIFDQLDTNKLNAHLKELMPGLTAKVFRTYNASITLNEMLHKETKNGNVAEKVVVYNQANKQVAIICNHQRSVSKSHSAQMSKLTEKIDELKALVEDLKMDLSRAKKGKPPLKDADGNRKRNLNPEAIEKKITQTNAKIEKMELNKQTKEDLKTVALGTSKINYLDPRITVAWCKRHEVPIEKMFNKSLLAKFAWAMDVDPDFRF